MTLKDLIYLYWWNIGVCLNLATTQQSGGCNKKMKTCEKIGFRPKIISEKW